jgi:hypothetical protein
MLFGVLLIFGGAGLLAGALVSVRRRLRAAPGTSKARARPRIGRSALLADTLPLQPVSAPGLVLPRSRSAEPSSSPGVVNADRRAPEPPRPPIRPAAPIAPVAPVAGRPAGTAPPGNRRFVSGRPVPPPPSNAPRPPGPATPTNALRSPGSLPVPSPPPPATAIPRVVPIKVVCVRTAVGRADVVRPPSGPASANWNGPTAVTPVADTPVRARNARTPDPSRRPH